MRSGAGLILILVGITALYLYNTGRLAAVLKVIRDPTAPTTTTIKSPVASGGLPGLPGIGPAPVQVGGGGAGAVQNAGACYASGGADIGACYGAWTGLNSWSDIKSALDSITSGFGFKF